MEQTSTLTRRPTAAVILAGPAGGDLRGTLKVSSLLTGACCYGVDIQVVKSILQNRANVDHYVSVCSSEFAPLIDEARAKFISNVPMSELMTHLSVVHGPPSATAVIMGHDLLLQELLNANANPDWTDSGIGISLVNLARRQGFQTCEMLLRSALSAQEGSSHALAKGILAL